MKSLEAIGIQSIVEEHKQQIQEVKENRRFTFIDLFAGIGGFHIALHNIGGECVFASECDDDARKTYEENFKKISPELFKNGKFGGDITKIDPNLIPDHDVLCAGFPCQPFSISGLQKGFEDTRGTLFFNILEIASIKKPKVLFLENVKHLIHHNQGNTFKVIIESLREIGYKPTWKVLNAKDFGLAQNRERIIIVAHRDKEFNFKKIKKEKGTILKDILEKDKDFEYLESDEYTILDKDLWKQQASGLIFCGYRNKKVRTVGARPNTEHLSRVHKQPNRIYYIEGTHPTLPAQETSGRYWIYNDERVRKLTIRECYRLQGFPEDFIISDKKTQSYIQVGNAVAIPMIEKIMEEIKEQLL